VTDKVGSSGNGWRKRATGREGRREEGGRYEDEGDEESVAKQTKEVMESCVCFAEESGVSSGCSV
jgi:hypothetical protein